MVTAATLLSSAVIAVAIILAGFTILSILELRRDPDYCGFPALTRCRLCENRVYVWQRRERREWSHEVICNVPPPFAPRVYLSAIVHAGCKGTPALDPIVCTVVES